MIPAEEPQNLGRNELQGHCDPEALAAYMAKQITPPPAAPSFLVCLRRFFGSP